MTHRIYVKSTRLRDWDYTAASSYFVTICTLDRTPVLGEVVNGEMQLSLAGRVVSGEWLQAQDVRANVASDEFMVMPNHVHGIVVIEEPRAATPRSEPHRVLIYTATPHGHASRPRLHASSLGLIMGQFKSISTKRIWTSGFRDFAWQPRSYDHIIRSEASLDTIRRYIRDNPMKWALDKDNPKGLRM